MQANTTTHKSEIKRQSHAPTFAKVKDGRKQDIRGLWVRNGRYYARLAIENPITGAKKVKRVPLMDKDNNPVQTVAQAIAQMARLKTQRTDNTLPVLDRQPKFEKFAADYLKSIAGAKKAGTVEKESAILARWSKTIGRLRLDQIKRVHVNRFIEARLKEKDDEGNAKVSPRTINLDLIAFRIVMKRALEDGLIQRLPTEGLRPLKTSQKKRELFSTADLEKLCAAALDTKETGDKKVPVTENGQQFADYIRLMAYSGCRRNEALGLQWKDVDSKNGQLHVRRQITHRSKMDEKGEFKSEPLKNGEERTVDFNTKLRSHLEDMKERARGASDWIFPSPQRGDKDIPAKTFRESCELVRDRAKMPGFGFHDCRHHFISMCVMSGIDFMTIAAWVGHKDGGVLIGKVYGHLADEHRKEMAEKVNFGPTVIQEAI
jgi:integrase